MLFRRELADEATRARESTLAAFFPGALTWLVTSLASSLSRLSPREWMLIGVIGYLCVQWSRDRLFIIPILRQADAAAASVEREIVRASEIRSSHLGDGFVQ